MTDEEIIKSFTELQLTTQRQDKEIQDIRTKQDQYGELLTTMQVFKNEQDHMKTDITEIKDTVKIIAEKPAKHWDSVVGTLITALAGAFIGWAISGFPGV